MLVPLRHIQAIEPSLRGGAGAVEKQDVGGDGGVGREHAAGHPNHCVQIELGKQLFLDIHLGIISAEQEAIGQDHRRPAVSFQPVHNDRHEEIRCLAAGQIVGKMIFYIRFLAAAIRRIHQYHIKLICLGVIQYIPYQGVVMVHPGHIQPMEQQVGDAQHIGELLFFNAVDGIPVLFGVGSALHLLLQLFQPADEKTAGAAGKVGHLLSDLGTDHLGHKVRDGPGRVEFTGGPGTLQLLQNGLIDLAEGMTLLIVTKIQVVNHIKDLPQQNTVFHVLIGICKGSLDNRFPDGRVRVHLDTFNQDLAVRVLNVLPLQHREQRVVYKFQQFVPSHGTAGLVVMGPVCPAARFRDDRLIIVFIPFPVLFLGVVYFQKQHPGDLLNALCITVDACIIAHNIPQPLYKSG